jgi:molybdate transport system substrate-binding protein
MKSRPLFLFLAALAVLPLPALRADGAQVSVAAAANLSFALDALDAEFKKEHPEITLTSMTGASGDIVAQIEHGAPYDVFLSADLHFPQVLIAAGKADAPTLTTFAIGQLVLWTTRDGLDLSDVPALVRNPAVQKLAIANVTTAPFGRAAKQALEKLGVWADAQPKLVVGESISQTTQFVSTGNADAGFVALSVVLAPKLKGKGHYVEIPASLYGPLDQGAVVTAQGAGNPLAREYIAFLRSPAAQAILTSFGYRIPAGP